MPGVSDDWDKFHRQERAKHPVARPKPISPRLDPGAAWLMGHAQRQVEDDLEVAQMVIDAAKRAPLSARVRGGASLEKAIKSEMRADFEQRLRQLPKPPST